MKKTIVMAMLCAAIAASQIEAAAPKAAKPAKKANTFTVLTANIGNMSVTRANYNRKFKAPFYNLGVLKDSLSKIGPDVIFIQEIDREGLESEKILFPGKYDVRCEGELCMGVNMEKFEYIDTCEKGNGFLLCSARIVTVKPIKEECKKVKNDYVCVSQRTLLKQEIVKLVNVHTSSPLNDKDFAIRRTQICDSLALIAEYDRQGYGVIMSGDFNFDPAQDRSSSLLKKGIVDDMAKLNDCWASAFSEQKKSDLNMINSDEPTWEIKEPGVLGIGKKTLRKCLDHIISNFSRDKCSILKENKNRLDISAKTPNGFMDHSAVLCSLKY
ncbi:MAG: endonuclease/exonuclease/phosphatase family protein [bacterium]